MYVCVSTVIENSEAQSSFNTKIFEAAIPNPNSVSQFASRNSLLKQIRLSRSIRRITLHSSISLTLPRPLISCIRVLTCLLCFSDVFSLVACNVIESGAVNLLVRALRLDVHAAQGDNPVVFVGPYEHHSNMLPWREAPVTLVTIGLDWSVFECSVWAGKAVPDCVFLFMPFLSS